MSPRRCWVLLAAAAWTVYVWGTRLFLMWGGDESTGFKVVHTVLALVSLGFAAAIAWIALDARRQRREGVNPAGEGSSRPAAATAGAPR